MSFGLESKETKKERRLSEVSDEESFNDDKRSIKTFPPLKLQEIETSWVERKVLCSLTQGKNDYVRSGGHYDDLNRFEIVPVR